MAPSEQVETPDAPVDAAAARDVVNGASDASRRELLPPIGKGAAAPKINVKEAGGVSVVVRVRRLPTYAPSLTAGFKGGDYDPTATIVRQDANVVYIVDPTSGKESEWAYDSVLPLGEPQESVYDKVVQPLIDRCLEGYNGTVFCYGQTASGKTYTMQGPDINKSSVVDDGIVQRVAAHITKRIEATRDMIPGYSATVKVTYLEVYNEKFNDLLAPNTVTKKELKVTFDPESPNGKDHTVIGLTERSVNVESDYITAMKLGAERRQVGATNMNAVSSRSHSVFTIVVEQRSPMNDGKNGIARKRSRINLVDLAGSERAESTGATGDRLKEGAAINQSLSALGNVVNALVNGKPGGHIPYRDSKLTHLLQDSLGGNALTVMIACLTPTAKNYLETVSTLRFAQRVKKGVKNNVSLNVDPNLLRIIQLEQEITELKAQLQVYRDGLLELAPAVGADAFEHAKGLKGALTLLQAIRDTMAASAAEHSTGRTKAAESGKVAPTPVELQQVVSDVPEKQPPPVEQREIAPVARLPSKQVTIESRGTETDAEEIPLPPKAIGTSTSIQALREEPTVSENSNSTERSTAEQGTGTETSTETGDDRETIPTTEETEAFVKDIKETLAKERRVTIVEAEVARRASVYDIVRANSTASSMPSKHQRKLIMDQPSFRLALRWLIVLAALLLLGIVAVIIALSITGKYVQCRTAGGDFIVLPGFDDGMRMYTAVSNSSGSCPSVGGGTNPLILPGAPPPPSNVSVSLSASTSSSSSTLSYAAPIIIVPRTTTTASPCPVCICSYPFVNSYNPTPTPTSTTTTTSTTIPSSANTTSPVVLLMIQPTGTSST